MSIQAQVASIVVAICLFGYVLNLVRRKKLEEKYSVIWMVLSLLMVVNALWMKPLFLVCRLLGISSAVSLVVLLLIAFVMMYSIHLSIQISTIVNEHRELIQWVGILRERSGIGRKPADGEQ